jgi:SAM-dependent methyltransferase
VSGEPHSRSIGMTTIADGWNHNAHYHESLLHAVPRPCRRALDVGCGLGSFARRLAGVAEQVDAIDREPAVASHARELSSGIHNLRVVEADFLTWPVEGSYDFVSMIATLHHLPFAEALSKAAGVLHPAGVLAVLGLDRAPSLLVAGARSAIAYPVSAYYRCTRHTSRVGAPTLEPSMTFDEVRRQAVEILPGAIVRRHLLWRFSLLWVKQTPIAP